MSNPKNDDLRDQAREEMNTIFIHSSVDEAGLTPGEFRVYSHIARRAGGGTAWPGIDSMAEVCRMHADTVRSCLKTLIQRRMINRRDRPGYTPLYTITRPSTWAYPPESKGGVNGRPPPETEGGVPPESKGGVPPETKGGEVHPRKEIQKRIERAKPSMTPTLEEVQEYAESLDMGPVTATRFFNYYDAVGWQHRGTRITNWQAKMRNWVSTEPEKSDPGPARCTL